MESRYSTPWWRLSWLASHFAAQSVLPLEFCLRFTGRRCMVGAASPVVRVPQPDIRMQGGVSLMTPKQILDSFSQTLLEDERILTGQERALLSAIVHHA